MHKILVTVNPEYIAGHLRSGHFEGYLDLSDAEFEKFKENSAEYIEDLDLLCRFDFEFMLDDFEVDDIGPIEDVRYLEIKK